MIIVTYRSYFFEGVNEMRKWILLLMLPFLYIIASCNAAQVIDPFPDIDEVVHGASDRSFYYSLGEVEERADIIVKAVVKDVIDQHVNTHYDHEFGKEIPSFGYTRRELAVTKVYEGDVKTGDSLVLLESYYVWTTDEGKEQLVNSSSLTPAKINQKYLFFLRYYEPHDGYWPVADYQGRYAMPSREIRDKVKANALEQADLDVYDHETLPYLLALYYEVFEKYFSPSKENVSEEEKLRLRNERVKAIYDPDMTLERLKEIVPVNMAVEDAFRLLGDHYNLELARSSWEEVIRYDFAGDDSYRYRYMSMEQDITDIDHDGLESGKMRFQVFLHLDDERMIEYGSIAYLGDDGHVHLLQLFRDGSTFDAVIERVHESSNFPQF